MTINSSETSEYFLIEATKVSPYVFLDKIKNRLIIKGHSILEASHQFYELILKKLQEFFASKKFITNFVLEIHFMYINTQAVKELLSIFTFLEESKIPVTVIWYYSDEEINDLGTQFCGLINLKFEKIYRKAENFEIAKND